MTLQEQCYMYHMDARTGTVCYVSHAQAHKYNIYGLTT